MDKLKKLFKHDKSDADTKSNPSRTQGDAAPSSTTSAQAPETNTAANASHGTPSGVLMTTNHGDIVIALYSDKTPRVLLAFHRSEIPN